MVMFRFRCFGFACLISVMEPQMSSLKQFESMWSAVEDCYLFWAGDEEMAIDSKCFESVGRFPNSQEDW